MPLFQRYDVDGKNVEYADPIDKKHDTGQIIREDNRRPRRQLENTLEEKMHALWERWQPKRQQDTHEGNGGQPNGVPAAKCTTEFDAQ